jgi:spore coat protein U-like protein
MVFFLFLFYSVFAEAACSVNATSMNFGSYDVFSAAPLDSTSNISVSCNRFTLFVFITIGASPNSGVFNPRQMKLLTGPDLLDYNLYTNAARTTIWGDGTGGTGFGFIFFVPRNGTRNRTVYGRIPPGQDISGGLYTDTLVATITY